MITRRTLMISTSALIAAHAMPAFADGHVVQMYNKDPDDKKRRMIYKPIITVVDAGTEIVFEPTDKGHNTESIKDMIPEGAEAWKSKINKEFKLTLDAPGFYGYKCTPHFSTGMVGLIVVKGDGMMANLEAAQKVKLRGKAKKVFASIWEEAEGMGLLTA
ncbi:MAG: pseudoazurin [Pseudomonadota bacterium]